MNGGCRDPGRTLGSLACSRDRDRAEATPRCYPLKWQPNAIQMYFDLAARALQQMKP